MGSIDVTETWWLAPVIAAALGVAAYAIKKYIDYLIKRILEGRIEIHRKVQDIRLATIIQIKGMLAEVRHIIDHIERGDQRDGVSYEDRCVEWCLRVRREAREKIAIVGDHLERSVKEATDEAKEYARTGSDESLRQWRDLYAQLESVDAEDFATRSPREGDQ